MDDGVEQLLLSDAVDLAVALALATSIRCHSIRCRSSQSCGIVGLAGPLEERDLVLAHVLEHEGGDLLGVGVFGEALEDLVPVIVDPDVVDVTNVAQPDQEPKGAALKDHVCSVEFKVLLNVKEIVARLDGFVVVVVVGCHGGSG